MNIIIPIGGKGERFAQCGYTVPKPLIPIFGKPMILHVLDRLCFEVDDQVFIFYYNLDGFDFERCILDKYPNVSFVRLTKQTSGAAETLYLGLGGLGLVNNGLMNRKTVVLDCDAFYGQDVLSMFRTSVGADRGAVFYTINTDPLPIFSYIDMVDGDGDGDGGSGSGSGGTGGIGCPITRIVEKQKISDFANTGIYCFPTATVLFEYAAKIVDQGIRVRGECYTSCIIADMLDQGYCFEGIELQNDYVFNVGTPKQLDAYVGATLVWLFDLDGTLVLTEDTYFEVWIQLLADYNIVLTRDMFTSVISGNSDSHVVSQLLPAFASSASFVDHISKKKDALFAGYVHHIRLVKGAREFLDQLYRRGHHLAIVTNCNRAAADLITSRMDLGRYVETIVVGAECTRPKPYSDPYVRAMQHFGVGSERVVIFEDSKTGLLSARAASCRCLVGIETLYSSAELISIGTNLTAADFSTLSYDTIIQFQNMSVEAAAVIKRYIVNSLVGWNIADIRLNEEKLKGGFISDVLALDIVLDSGEVRGCVLKLESQSESFLLTMSKQLDLYEREYLFYSISDAVPINIPRFYGIVRDDNGRNIGILMENLCIGPAKYILNLNLGKGGVGIDVSLRVISAMATMHAKFWGQDLQNRFIGLKKHDDPTFAFCADFVRERWPRFLRSWSSTLTEVQVRFAQSIVSRYADIQREMSRGPLTLCHGDIKSANIFYREMGQDMGQEVGRGMYEPYFIDWQYTILGKGVQDLVFFMIESFDTDTMRNYQTICKDYYYLQLLERGVTQYSRIEYETDFALAAKYFPFFVAIWFGTVDEEDLIDKQFPATFIQKLFAFYSMQRWT